MTEHLMHRYAALGYRVLPLHSPNSIEPHRKGNKWVGGCTCGDQGCESPAKHPRTRNGLTDATVDHDTIDLWLRRWPDLNVGIECSGLVVPDCDGPLGRHRWLQYVSGEGWPRQPWAMTGGGGWHVVYRGDARPNVGVLDHVDVRAAGSYIVAAPSRHVSGGVYEWVRELPPIADIPPVTPLVAALVARRTSPILVGASRDTGDRGSRYGIAALEREVGRVACAAEGTRNQTLNVAAFSLGQLVAGGELHLGQVVRALTVAATRAGLGERETVATITSGLRSGQSASRRRR